MDAFPNDFDRPKIHMRVHVSCESSNNASIEAFSIHFDCTHVGSLQLPKQTINCQSRHISPFQQEFRLRWWSHHLLQEEGLALEAAHAHKLRRQTTIPHDLHSQSPQFTGSGSMVTRLACAMDRGTNKSMASFEHVPGAYPVHGDVLHARSICDCSVQKYSAPVEWMLAPARSISELHDVFMDHVYRGTDSGVTLTESIVSCSTNLNVIKPPSRTSQEEDRNQPISTKSNTHCIM
mmetsp:Transcript_28005/g.45744  ORF Transcript_28005/g.45744 Transcript_28005/m.45744 type:complete len:235 (-) Transcript_28005:66-770(-)